MRIAFTVPPRETNLPWSGPRSLLTQLSPMVETLLDIDPDTGAYVPMLATNWEMAPDGKSWTMDLRENVVFHSGFGAFDAKDVVHTRNLMGPPEGNLNTFRDTWATKVEDVELVDDHRVVFRLGKPDPNMDFFLSPSGDLAMLSKNQWDQEGQDGMEERFVSTGPYQYLEREVGQSITYERVPYEHWRVPNADFREMEQVWAPESATRLAMLLTGEAHIAELPRDVLAQAVSEGMEISQSGLGAIMTWIVMGGQYFVTGDEAYDPTVPLRGSRRAGPPGATSPEQSHQSRPDQRVHLQARWNPHVTYTAFIPPFRAGTRNGKSGGRKSMAMIPKQPGNCWHKPATPTVSL